MSTERELSIVIRARDLASKAVAGLKGQLNSIGKQASKGLQNAAHNISRGIQIAGVAALGGLAYSVKAAGDFEARMNTLNTIARTTGDAFSGALGQIGDSLRKVSRDTGTPLEELTTAYYDLLSAGIKTADAQNVLEASNRLAIGGLASTAETVDLLTTAINSYGGDATKAAQYADQFAVAIERGKVTAAEIAEGFAQVGPMASVMGIGVDQISASLAQMTAKGTPAAEAFTQMRAAMVALQRQTPEMRKVLDELGIANVGAEVASRGLVPVWDDLRRKADELGIPLIKLTGRVEGTLFALSNTGPEFEAFSGHLDAVRKGTGTAQAQMEERQQGLNFQLARMKAIVNDVAITLGSKLIPKIVPLLQRLAGYIEANQAKISRFADQVAAGFERAVKWALSLDWNAIGNSLKMAADFGKGLVEAFLSMPDWVKQAVITGWGLNKLTGGALGGILGSVATGLIKGVLGINAGVVNVKGAVVNAPGGGLGGVGGATGGKFLPTGAAGWAGLLGVAVADAFLVKTAIDVGNDQARGIGSAKAFEAKIVEDRTQGATLDELVRLRKDLAGEIEREMGDPLSGLLKWAAVNPTLQGQLEDLDAQIAAQQGDYAGRHLPAAAHRNTVGDAAGADQALLARYGGKLDKLATNDVLEHLSRTTEMGLKGVGTSFESGIKTGMDPLGDIATRILARAEDPKAPAVMNEIQGHLGGLEEIQASYLANGDVKLAAKVQANIDTLHGLLGTTDKHRAVTERLAAEAKSSDRAMIATAERTRAEVTSKGAAQLQKQAEALSAVRGQSGYLSTIAAKNMTANVNVALASSTRVVIDGREVVSLASLRQTTNLDSPELRGFI